jgi:N-acetylglucosamine-6-phosphate deacetylase
MPGFVDVHVHGAVGHEAMDGSADGLLDMARFYATRGVTSFLATTWTATDADILHALGGVTEAMRRVRDPSAARLLGVHLEGPYINPERPGAQDPAPIRPARPEEALAYLDSGLLRLITLAPEIPGNAWLIDECVRRGVTVSAGHTSATYDEIGAAVVRGLSHLTHTYNAMSPLHHREPGVVGAAMTMPGLRCELIADNVHVHPVAMQALVRARGVEGILLVSDAVRPTGLPDGQYAMDDRTVTLADGAVRLPDGTLAGSVLTMDRALRNLAAATGIDAAGLWRATSGNPATDAGVADRTGALVAGLDADLVLLDDRLEVAMTVVEGCVAYARDTAGTPVA